MNERMIFAGFGGQGILTIGKLLAACAMQEDRHVTFFPSYGSEVRGGTAHCHVVIADEPIASPLVEEATTLLIMNEPSLNRYLPQLGSDGLLVMNVSMIGRRPKLESGRMLKVPATELAGEIGDIRVANTLMLAALNEARTLVRHETLHDLLVGALSGRRAKTLPANDAALEKGRAIAREWRRKQGI
ncbi:MAG TPA: 2-oxoacid:acceptor oxidoreductase family protein [Planctomycetota bacterium]|nr:2-oxoacid:acceptor oxidoreductase family protein [Planctomycetota bacterium]